MKKIVVIVALLIIAIPFLGYLLLVISLSGGIDGVVNDLKPAPNPESSNVATKRSYVKQSIETSFTELDNKIGHRNYATSFHDRCYQGQNNWKVKDGYAHRCDYRLTKYYGFNGDFRQEMLVLDQKLVSASWSPVNNSRTMQKILVNYFDARKQTCNFPEGCLVSNLPEPVYKKNDKRMELEFAEKDTKDLFGIKYTQEVSGDTLFGVYENKEFQDVNAIFQKITKDNKYILVISIQENYFQN